MDNQPRDRDELLSAYLDGEVTPAERRQVRQWLANDAEVQRQYRQLCQVRQGLQAMARTSRKSNVAAVEQRVFRRLRWRRVRQGALWGGGAVAAALAAAIGLLSPSSQGPAPQFVERSPKSSPSVSSPTEGTSPVANSPETGDALRIELNQPTVEVPQAQPADGSASPNAKQL